MRGTVIAIFVSLSSTVLCVELEFVLYDENGVADPNGPFYVDTIPGLTNSYNVRDWYEYRRNRSNRLSFNNLRPHSCPDGIMKDRLSIIGHTHESGRTTLAMVLDVADDNDGGDLDMRVTSPSWLLPANYLYPFWWAGVDDDGECDYDDGEIDCSFRWDDCCTDGLVFGPMGGHVQSAVGAESGMVQFTILADPDGLERPIVFYDAQAASAASTGASSLMQELPTLDEDTLMSKTDECSQLLQTDSDGGAFVESSTVAREGVRIEVRECVNGRGNAPCLGGSPGGTTTETETTATDENESPTPTDDGGGGNGNPTPTEPSETDDNGGGGNTNATTSAGGEGGGDTDTTVPTGTDDNGGGGGGSTDATSPGDGETGMTFPTDTEDNGGGGNATTTEPMSTDVTDPVGTTLTDTTDVTDTDLTGTTPTDTDPVGTTPTDVTDTDTGGGTLPPLPGGGSGTPMPTSAPAPEGAGELLPEPNPKGETIASGGITRTRTVLPWWAIFMLVVGILCCWCSLCVVFCCRRGRRDRWKHSRFHVGSFNALKIGQKSFRNIGFFNKSTETSQTSDSDDINNVFPNPVPTPLKSPELSTSTRDARASASASSFVLPDTVQTSHSLDDLDKYLRSLDETTDSLPSYPLGANTNTKSRPIGPPPAGSFERRFPKAEDAPRLYEDSDPEESYSEFRRPAMAGMGFDNLQSASVSVSASASASVSLSSKSQKPLLGEREGASDAV